MVETAGLLKFDERGADVNPKDARFPVLSTNSGDDFQLHHQLIQVSNPTRHKLLPLRPPTFSQTMLRGYNKHIRPMKDLNQPTLVNISLHINHISSIVWEERERDPDREREKGI